MPIPSSAGADTTAIAILYNLMRNPTLYKKLTAEVDAAVADGTLSIPIPYAEAVKLPYLNLNACINERTRLHPNIKLNNATIRAHGRSNDFRLLFPRVGVNGAVVQYSTIKMSLVPRPINFNPDHWIEGDDVRRDRTMDLVWCRVAELHREWMDA